MLYKKSAVILFVIIFGGAAPLLAAKTSVTSDDSARALEALYRMHHSMDHITTFQSDITVSKTTPSRSSVAQYTFKTDSLGNALAILHTEPKHTHVTNKKGYYLIINGKAVKQPEFITFPFKNPTQFLADLDPAEVTASHKILLHKETDKDITIRLFPVDTGGASIEQALKNPVALLELVMDKPAYTLTGVKIYRDTALTRFDALEFRYDTVTNNTAIKDPVFDRMPGIVKDLSLVYSRSTAAIPPSDSSAKGASETVTQITETHYRNVIINEPLPAVLFDEEEY